METELNPSKLIDLAIKKGADQVEIYHLKDECIKVQTESGHIKTSGEIFSDGVGFRVLKNKSLGFTYTTDFRKDTLEKTIENAIKIAKLLKSKKVEFSFPKKGKPSIVKKIYSKELGELNASQALELMNRLLDAIKSNKKNYEIVPTYGLIECHKTHVFLYNSQGFDDSYKKTDMLGGIRTLINKYDKTGNGFEAQFCSQIENFNPENIGYDAGKQAIDNLESKKIDTCKTDLIIGPHGNAKLFIPFTKAIYANNIKNKQSLFIDKIGEEIGSKNLFMYDDGTYEGGLGSAPFDDEGVSSKRKCIVEGGLLKNYLYDLETASEAGIEGTGNGIRCTFYPNHNKYKFNPTVGVTNFILKKGDNSKEDLISEIKNGVLATFLVGDGDPASGDFSFEIRNGYQIENGEIKHSLRQASFSGNLSETLKNIQEIGDDSRMTQAFIGVGQGTFITPSIRISDALIVAE